MPLHNYDSESEDIIKIDWGFSDEGERAIKEVCEESKVKLT